MGWQGGMGAGGGLMTGPSYVPDNASRIVFVGNLPFEIDPDAIFKALKQCGYICAIRTCFDKETNQPKGYD